jgi:hypothetical protein
MNRTLSADLYKINANIRRKRDTSFTGRPSSVSSELCLKKIFHALSGGHSTTIRQKYIWIKLKALKEILSPFYQ